MANDTIQFLPAELRSAASKIDSMAEDYQVQYDALYKETDAMIVAWDGKDNVAYTTQIAGFKDDFQKMKELMSEYAKFLRNAADTYEKTQETIAAEAKKLTN